MGTWVQESVEADKLEKIMLAEGTNWAVRRMMRGLKREIHVDTDESGKLHLKIPFPIKGPLDFRAEWEEKSAKKGKAVEVTMMGILARTITFWQKHKLVQVVRKKLGQDRQDVESTVEYALDKVKRRIIVTNYEQHGEYKVVMKPK